MEERKTRVRVARGLQPAELVLKNARWLNVFTCTLERGDIAIQDGVIAGLGSYQGRQELDLEGRVVVPGLIDAHIHLESSIISPPRFAGAVIPHGTTTVVADPHEIANVLGTEGMAYMLAATERLPLDVFFTLPSCVPASPFDEAGAELTPEILASYYTHPRVLGLGEMMNYPGVLAGDTTALQKLEEAAGQGLRLDGHAPGMRGPELMAYVGQGIDSDHECTTLAEAQEKLRAGQWIMIREGTASRNLEALMGLFAEPWWRRCVLATDDKHPGELMGDGHIDHILRRAIAGGANPLPAFVMASWNAAQRFGLRDRGAIAPGYLADLVVLDDLPSVRIRNVYKAGRDVTHWRWRGGESAGAMLHVRDSVHTGPLPPEAFALKRTPAPVIGLVPGELLTTDNGLAPGVDIDRDIVKLCVIERHRGTGHVGVCLLQGYGLKSGAVATTVAHDSHNIIVAGVSDEDIRVAVEGICQMHGGMCVVSGGAVAESLPLPIAGLMCDISASAAAGAIARMKQLARKLGVNPGVDPFMTLSFLSLPVIPKRKLTTLGLVDVDDFALVDPAD